MMMNIVAAKFTILKLLRSNRERVQNYGEEFYIYEKYKVNSKEIEKLFVVLIKYLVYQRISIQSQTNHYLRRKLTGQVKKEN